MSPPRACILYGSTCSDGGVAVPGTSRCREHAYKSNWKPRSGANPYRTAAWKATRKRQLTLEPDCRECGRPATDVDHIIPLSRGGTSYPGNLQSLCMRCHRSKTARDSNRGGTSTT